MKDGNGMISDAELEVREAWAAMPAKSALSASQLEVWMQVAELKNEQGLRRHDIGREGKPINAPALAPLLEFALSSGDFDFFDQFAKAWNKLRPAPVGTISIDGSKITSSTGGIGNNPRRKVAFRTVAAIKCLQAKLGAVPTRPEILEFVAGDGLGSEKEPGMSASQLSEILKELSLQDRIPHARDVKRD